MDKNNGLRLGAYCYKKSVERHRAIPKFVVQDLAPSEDNVEDSVQCSQDQHMNSYLSDRVSLKQNINNEVIFKKFV